jgi:CRP/FNR family transcriptional regulator, anaerobic regulatory protein
MHPHEVQRITETLPFLSLISQEEWNYTQLITVDPSTPHTIREGHVFQHAIFVLSGIIRIYKMNEQGREVTLYRVQSGQSCVLMMASILGEIEYEASASIESESEILLIPVDKFKTWMDHHSPLKQFIYKQFIQRINAVSSLLENIAFKPMSYRLAQLLIQSTNEKNPILRLTHDQLAIELGTAREVISRTLQDFQRRGFLTLNRGKISILDRLALENILNQYLV